MSDHDIERDFASELFVLEPVDGDEARHDGGHEAKAEPGATDQPA
jgi:hypothetical protein